MPDFVLDHFWIVPLMAFALSRGVFGHWTVLERIGSLSTTNIFTECEGTDCDGTNKTTDLCSLGPILDWSSVGMLHNVELDRFLPRCLLCHAIDFVSIDACLSGSMQSNDRHLRFFLIVNQNGRPCPLKILLIATFRIERFGCAHKHTHMGSCEHDLL